MDDKSNTRFGVIQYYPNCMDPYFNPLIVVSQALIQIDLNPNIIKNLWVEFSRCEGLINYGGSKVRITIDLNISMPNDWVDHMESLLSKYLKNAFLKSYDI